MLETIYKYLPNIKIYVTNFEMVLVELVGSDIDDFILDSPISDGPFMDGTYTIEENFEEALGSVSMIPEAVQEHREASLTYDKDFSDVARYGIVDVVGDDTYGRKVIVVSACRLPSNKVLDQNRFLRLYHFSKPF